MEVRMDQGGGNLIAGLLFIGVLWGLPMWINGAIASHRRHSVLLWVFIGLAFSWLSVLFAALMQDRRAIEEELEDLRYWRRQQRRSDRY
jgi:hypothetical protein